MDRLYWPHTDHLYQLHTDHILTTHQLHTDHILTMYVPSTYWPPLPPNRSTCSLLPIWKGMKMANSVPSGSVAGVFAGTASTMAIVRKKDDFKNWMVGGAVSGSLFGLTSKCQGYFINSSAFSGWKLFIVINGWKLNKNRRRPSWIEILPLRKNVNM